MQSTCLVFSAFSSFHRQLKHAFYEDCFKHSTAVGWLKKTIKSVIHNSPDYDQIKLLIMRCHHSEQICGRNVSPVMTSLPKSKTDQVNSNQH